MTPDDKNPFDALSPYERRNLLVHCGEVGQFDAVHKVLMMSTPTGANAWFTLHYSEGTIGDYSKDIEFAFSLHDRQARDCKSFDRMAAYALIRSNASTISENVPPELLRALVHSKLWDATRALTFARSLSSPFAKPVALAAVMHYLPKREAKLLLGEIVNSIKSIVVPVRFYEERPPDDPRFTMLVEVISMVEPALLPEIVALLDLVPDWQRQRGASYLAQALPTPHLEPLLENSTALEPAALATLFLKIAPSIESRNAATRSTQIALSCVVGSNCCSVHQLIALLHWAGPEGRNLVFRRTMLSKERLSPHLCLALLPFPNEFGSRKLAGLARRGKLRGKSAEVFATILRLRSIKSTSQAKLAIRNVGAFKKLAGLDGCELLELSASSLSTPRRFTIVREAAKAVVSLSKNRDFARATERLIGLSRRTSPKEKVRLTRLALEIAMRDGCDRATLISIFEQAETSDFDNCLLAYRAFIEEEDDSTFEVSRDYPSDRLISALFRLASARKKAVLINELKRIEAPMRRAVALLRSYYFLNCREDLLLQALNACLQIDTCKELNDHLLAWLNLFEPTQSTRSRSELALPTDLYTIDSTGEFVKSHERAMSWLAIIPANSLGRTKLAEIYLRHFARTNRIFHPYSKYIPNPEAIGIIPHLGERRRRAMLRILFSQLGRLPMVQSKALARGFLAEFAIRTDRDLDGLKSLAKIEEMPAPRGLLDTLGSKDALAKKLTFASLVRRFRIDIRRAESITWRTISPSDVSPATEIVCAFSEALYLELNGRKALRAFPTALADFLSKARCKQLALFFLKRRGLEASDRLANQCEAIDYFIASGSFDDAAKIIRELALLHERARMLAKLAESVEPSDRLFLLREALMLLRPLDLNKRTEPAQAVAKAFNFLSHDEKTALLSFWWRELSKLERRIALSESRIVVSLEYALFGVCSARGLSFSVRQIASWWP
jgi:hypothetical protein